jgi:hypothetical protein
MKMVCLTKSFALSYFNREIIILDKDILKWKSRLQTKAKEHNTLIKNILKKQTKQRGLAARAARKRRAAMALAVLCGDVPDDQLKEVGCIYLAVI